MMQAIELTSNLTCWRFIAVILLQSQNTPLLLYNYIHSRHICVKSEIFSKNMQTMFFCYNAFLQNYTLDNRVCLYLQIWGTPGVKGTNSTRKGHSVVMFIGWYGRWCGVAWLQALSGGPVE